MIRRPPRSTPLSLHDALPIYLCGSRSPPACLSLLSAVEKALRGRRDVATPFWLAQFLFLSPADLGLGASMQRSIQGGFMSFAGTPSSSDSMPYEDNRKIRTNNLQGPARIILATNGKGVACIGAELAKWGYAARIFDPNELPGVHRTYRTRRLRVSLSRVVPLRIPSQISKREFAGRPDSAPKRFSLPSHSSAPADCKRLVPERHKSGQRQEERDCCDLCGSRSPPACLCLLSAVRRRCAGAAMFGLRRVMFFSEAVSRRGLSQWENNFSQRSPLMAARGGVVDEYS